MDLDAFISGNFFGFMLVFARIGTAAMFLPGFAESYINTRSRLALAALVSLALYPATPVPAAMPSEISVAAGLLAIEALVGAWIGTMARVIFAGLHFAGSLIGYSSGLANALAPSLGSFEGATAVASALLLTAATLIFATDTHHTIIRALIFSYDMIPYGEVPRLGTLAEQMARAAAAAMRIGLSVAAPVVVMSILLNVGLGLANRAMPNLPVFFVAQSGIIGAGLLVVALASGPIIQTFLAELNDWLSRLAF